MPLPPPPAVVYDAESSNAVFLVRVMFILCGFVFLLRGVDVESCLTFSSLVSCLV